MQSSLGFNFLWNLVDWSKDFNSISPKPNKFGLSRVMVSGSRNNFTKVSGELGIAIESAEKLTVSSKGFPVSLRTKVKYTKWQ